MFTIMQIEKMTEGKAVEALKSWGTDKLEKELSKQQKRNAKAMEFRDSDNMAGAAFLIGCLERVIDFRLAR